MYMETCIHVTCKVMQWSCAICHPLIYRPLFEGSRRTWKHCYSHCTWIVQGARHQCWFCQAAYKVYTINHVTVSIKMWSLFQIAYISLCFTSIVCRDWLICIMCKQMKRSSSTCCSCWCVQCNDYQQTQIWEISYCTHHICRTGVCSATKMALTLEDWLYMPNWCSTTNRNTLVEASFPPCGKRDPGHLIRLNYNSAMTSRLTYLLPM